MSRIPLLLKPTAKDYLWGGSRLNDDFGKDINLYPLAETWECSTHPDGPSIVSGGAFDGLSITEVLSTHPDYLGTHPLRITGGKPEIPILIKLIDAKQNLSVQVHPDDDYALKMENSLGKTEMWYVLAACSGAKLTCGFKQDVSHELVENALNNGTITNYLNSVAVKKGDVFFIEPGTVHAIGAGVLIAEIQESSNITYRLYDYDRTDKNGNKRELHIKKALEVASLSAMDSPRQPMRILSYRKGYARELLSRCKYFQCERMIINTEIRGCKCEFRSDNNSFHALLCIDGCGVLFGNHFSKVFYKGDCFFVPANSESLHIHGRAQLLDVWC